MDKIAIQTSQNIAIEQIPASVGERIVAALIDYGIISVIILPISIIAGLINSSAIFVIIALPLLFYHLVSELAMDGQSWGKKIMKIKVVKIDGSRVDFTSYLIRWMFRLIDVLLLFGGISVVVIILTGKGQRIGDIAAHTTVIRLKQQNFDKESIFTQLPDNYIPVIPQVSRLCDEDIHTAKEVLVFISDSFGSSESWNMALKAKSAIEAKMGIRSDLSPEEFLKTVLMDYNYLHSR